MHCLRHESRLTFSNSTNGLETFSFRLLDSESVQKKLSSLNVWKSIGLDGFSDRLLKECAEGNSPPLVHVFKSSLQSRCFFDGLEAGRCQSHL